MRRKSSIPVENKAAKEAAKNKMFAALSRKTGLTAKEVNITHPTLFIIGRPQVIMFLSIRIVLNKRYTINRRLA